ncbi:MAG TPA: DUF1854 domain-containing protein [Candidatus Binatia bacterium]|nr:DUF1854 domain-containing protein [Candidatus Binatia bacterium]
MAGGLDRNTMVDPRRVKLYRASSWAVNLIIDDRTSPRVQIVRAAPLSDPDHYIAILDEQDDGICVIRDPAELDEPSRQIVQEELRWRYLTAVVQRIEVVRHESGGAYFEVETDQGHRTFIVKHGAESIRSLGPRLLIVDVDGNRFEIADVNALDSRSARLLRSVL